MENKWDTLYHALQLIREWTFEENSDPAWGVKRHLSFLLNGGRGLKGALEENEHLYYVLLDEVEPNADRSDEVSR